MIGEVAAVISALKALNDGINTIREAGKNAIILDPDGYMMSLFEPNFSAEKTIQSGGYIGFTPA